MAAITLNLESQEDLTLILTALETQAIHYEMDHRWDGAENCRGLAQELFEANPLPPLTEYQIEMEDGTFLQTVSAESASDAYNIYVQEHFGNGNCSWAINVIDPTTDPVTIVEFN